MDLVTMLSRLAAFTGELLLVLTPKIRKTTFERSKLPFTDEYSPEVSKARQQASEREKSARNIKTVFLKKLNKILIGCLKLYVDNLVCMDLCGWSSAEAVKLLGEQQLHHLNRRRDVGEIWGCRHMVEAKHGMHPNGIPCSKKQTENFEHITRDMCIRINNVHVLITIFHSLEDHLYSMIRTGSKKPITAFGYVSSDHSEVTPNMNLLRGKNNKPHPSRTRQQPVNPIHNEQRDITSWPSSVSTGLGPMEPDGQNRLHAAGGPSSGGVASANSKKSASEGDKDTPPRQSLECLEYLKRMQEFQVRMIAIRMNKFCKIALSELLGLKLTDCSIEKRLFPVVDYLDRHRVALRKYIYPDCFSAIMEHVWEYLLQDLEDEAVRLRASKRPITDRAQMLLQALAHLIQFMHNRNNGLDLDKLNATSEYLQGLLDIMTRSTDQLINIFNKLNNAHFTRNMLDLNQAPVVLDSQVLSQLRLQLRSNKKCFTGREFVVKVMEIGRGALVEALDNEVNVEGRPSAGPGSHVLSPTGQPIDYNEDYACAVAQYLLDEHILVHVTDVPPVSEGSSVLLTPDQHTDEEGSHLASSFEGKELSDSVQRLGINSAVSFASEGMSAADSPSHLRRGRQSASTSNRAPSSTSQDRYSSQSQRYQYTPASSSRSSRRPLHHHHRRLERPHFIATGNMFYKFASSEDSEFAFFQSQILMSSMQTSSRNASPTASGEDGHSPNGGAGLHLSQQSLGSLREENRDFDYARQGTLCLVYDLLTQRARKERVAKQFVTSPMVQEQRRQVMGAVNCDLIFKM